VNDELERIWKDPVVAHLKLLYKHLFEETEENHVCVCQATLNIRDESNACDVRWWRFEQTGVKSDNN
jgi:hypothetical protein